MKRTHVLLIAALSIFGVQAAAKGNAIGDWVIYSVVDEFTDEKEIWLRSKLEKGHVLLVSCFDNKTQFQMFALFDHTIFFPRSSHVDLRVDNNKMFTLEAFGSRDTLIFPYFSTELPEQLLGGQKLRWRTFDYKDKVISGEISLLGYVEAKREFDEQCGSEMN